MGLESCDDGGNGGCRDDCSGITHGWYCAESTGPPVEHTCATDPTDGIVAGTEVCDDGNSSPGDGCFSNLVEDDYECYANMAGKSVCNLRCGNSRREDAYEQCDDGNILEGDGCDSQCN